DVRILIGRDVDAFGAGAVDDLDGVHALAPDIGAKRLDVRDVNGNPRFAADANHLFNRTEQADCVRAFVALMSVVHAPPFSAHFGQLDHLFGLRVTARRVIQTSGQAE